MRRTLAPLTALVLLFTVGACGPGSGGKSSSSRGHSPGTTPTIGTDDDDDSSSGSGSSGDTGTHPTPAASPSPTPTRRRTAALTCEKLRNARVGSPTVKYNGYPDYIPLSDGRWSGEDGATVLLQKPCGIGDLDGDGAADAVGVVMLDGGGTGRFWTVVVWRNVGGQPRFVALKDLGDRTPVEQVGISSRRARIVYLTRSEDAAMAELNIRRTAIHRLSGNTFPEVSHVDAPYTP